MLETALVNTANPQTLQTEVVPVRLTLPCAGIDTVPSAKKVRRLTVCTAKRTRPRLLNTWRSTEKIVLKQE